MTYPFLSHHGGTHSVTGSCHQLYLDSAFSLLVDCGLEQVRGSEWRGLGGDQF